MALKHPKVPSRQTDERDHAPLFGMEPGRLSRHRCAPGEMPPEVAYQIIHDELMLDGNARLNLATFVSTWAEPQADRLMAECFDVSNALREHGWLLPAYTFPKNREELAALRVVVKRDFTHDMADFLVHDLKRLLPRLEKQPVPVHDHESGSGFHH